MEPGKRCRRTSQIRTRSSRGARRGSPAAAVHGQSSPAGWRRQVVVPSQDRPGRPHRRRGQRRPFSASVPLGEGGAQRRDCQPARSPARPGRSRRCPLPPAGHVDGEGRIGPCAPGSPTNPRPSSGSATPTSPCHPRPTLQRRPAASSRAWTSRAGSDAPEGRSAPITGGSSGARRPDSSPRRGRDRTGRSRRGPLRGRPDKGLFPVEGVAGGRAGAGAGGPSVPR
jgi:hypothetical protein